MSAAVRHQVISSDQATPASVQPKAPCSDCPWARASMPGWLGPMDATGWIQCAGADGKIVCHVHPNVECAGAAIYRANTVKSLRDPTLLRLPQNKELVFANPMEFMAHHESKKALKLPRWAVDGLKQFSAMEEHGPDPNQEEDQRCVRCRHTDQHYTSCPVDTERWLCEHPGCDCDGFKGDSE